MDHTEQPFHDGRDTMDVHGQISLMERGLDDVDETSGNEDNDGVVTRSCLSTEVNRTGRLESEQVLTVMF